MLLLGNDDRVVLAVARGLGREGISVDVAWCSENSPALKSRYIRQFHQISNYDADSKQWLESLNGLVRSNNFDLVIPCNDFAVIPLQTEKAGLAPEVNWYLINEDAFTIAFDKSKTTKVANSLGIRTPLEYRISYSEAQRIGERGFVDTITGQPINFPIYLKPVSSVTNTDVENKRSVRRAESASELAIQLRDDCPPDGLLIQESFDGVGIGVEVLASDGKILMQFQHQRLRETLSGGSTYRKSIAEIAELSDATAKLVRRLNYTGVAMFEYRYCRETGNWVFLEINARFWGSLPLAIASGMNFPVALYELLIHGRRNFDTSYAANHRCRNLVEDLRAFGRQNHSPLGIGSLVLCRDHLDFFAIDDWRPQIAQLASFSISCLNKIVRRFRIAGARSQTVVRF